LASRIPSSSEIPRIFSKLYRDPTERNFLNFFYSSSISILDKFLCGKLFLTSSSFHPYFLWNFWSQLGPPFGRISLNYFKLIQINVKHYCSYGLGHPAFFSGRSTRASAPPMLSLCPLTGRPRLSVALPPGTVLWPTRQTPLPSLFSPVGARPHGTPAPCGTPTPRPHLFPPLFPSAALPSSRSLPARAAPLVSRLHSSPTFPLERPSLPTAPRTRTAASGHRRPVAHSPSWILAEHLQRPPLPCELLPELPIPAISYNFLTSLPLRCCRTPHPPSPPTGAPSPPPPDAVCAASPSTRRSGKPLSSPPCPAPSP
jgi:hypothetical protein